MTASKLGAWPESGLPSGPFTCGTPTALITPENWLAGWLDALSFGFWSSSFDFWSAGGVWAGSTAGVVEAVDVTGVVVVVGVAGVVSGVAAARAPPAISRPQTAAVAATRKVGVNARAAARRKELVSCPMISPKSENACH